MSGRITAGTGAARPQWTWVQWIWAQWIWARWANVALAAALAVGLAGTGPVRADPHVPAENEVIGYANAERGGAGVSWTLPAGMPYLFVPDVKTGSGSDAGDGSLAVADAGAGVGAVLFQRPYFGAHDVRCAPDLGSDARPDLKWRGATARFAPPVEASALETPAGAGQEPAQGAGVRFSSLIVYRKDLGPPPGALLLNRRLILGQSCPRASDKIFFDRLFVPIAAPPEAAHCINLTGTFPREGSQDFKLDFTSADRLVLMQPADLDDSYRGIRHRFRVLLFDGDGCRGGAGDFRSAGKEAGDIKLDAVGLRDRARSIKIVYEGGPLAPYYAVPAPAPVASTAPVPHAKPTTVAAAPSPAETAPAQAAPAETDPVEPTPATPTAETPAPPNPAPPNPAPVEKVQAEPVATPPAAAPEPAEAAPEPAVQAQKAPEQTAPEQKAEASTIKVQPVPDQTASRPPAPAPAAAPEPIPAEPMPAEPMPAKAAAVEALVPAKLAAPAAGANDDVVTANAPRPAEAPAAPPQPEPISLQVAMPAPRLQMPVGKPVKPAALPASATFEYPVFEIYRLNYCLRWGADCGAPAANAWCRTQGYAKASKWQVDKNIGALFPTIVLADKRVCAQFPCDGFETITCSK